MLLFFYTCSDKLDRCKRCGLTPSEGVTAFYADDGKTPAGSTILDVHFRVVRLYKFVRAAHAERERSIAEAEARLRTRRMSEQVQCPPRLFVVVDRFL